MNEREEKSYREQQDWGQDLSSTLRYFVPIKTKLLLHVLIAGFRLGDHQLSLMTSHGVIFLESHNGVPSSDLPQPLP